MKLRAISDIHVGHPANRAAIAALPSFGDDWLILAGDVGETEQHLRFALGTLSRRFAKVIWAPGNHDLWTVPGEADSHLRGEAKYRRMVEVCHDYGALTPEDPYPRWEGEGGQHLIAPLFVLYDYSFRPDSISEEGALAWAEEVGIVCTDELLLHPDPHPSRQAWCAARVAYTEARLAAAQGEDGETPLLLVNHFPLDERLLKFVMLARFSLWCGTRRTRGWHTRYRVSTVVYGHTHRRATDVLDGVRFEEVSLGYPRDWSPEVGAAGYVRTILPAPAGPWREPWARAWAAGRLKG